MLHATVVIHLKLVGSLERLGKAYTTGLQEVDCRLGGGL
jgi:hypothetical protein